MLISQRRAYIVGYKEMTLKSKGINGYLKVHKGSEKAHIERYINTFEVELSVYDSK